MKSRLSTMYALVVICLFIGCSSSESPDHAFRVFQEDGITIAETGFGPKYSGDLFTYEPVLRLEQVPEKPDSYLRYGVGFLKGQDGFFYVPDTGNNRIAVFDPEGKYVRAFGQDGEGPGDLRSFNLQAINGDKLEIFDYILGRLTLFNTDGSLHELIRLPDSSGNRNGYYRTPDGIQVLVEFHDPWVPGPQNAVWKRILLYDAADDTMAVIETGKVATSFRHGPGLRAGTPIPYAPIPVGAWQENKGILVGSSDAPVLEWFDYSGTLIGRIILDIQPDVIGPELRRSIEARYDRGIEQATGAARDFRKQQREGLIIPEVKGWWGNVFIDSGGYIWLQRTTALWERNQPIPYRVLSPEGEYLGDTTMPVQRARVQDGFLMGTTEDEETGELIPTVYQIVPAVPGLKYPGHE